MEKRSKSFFSNPTMNGAFPISNSTSVSGSSFNASGNSALSPISKSNSGSGSSSNGSGTSAPSEEAIDWPSATIDELLKLLLEPEYRENALTYLTRIRETEKDLAVRMWNVPNIVCIFILEVTSVFWSLSPELLTFRASSRACNVLTLLQCLATHPETKMSFLQCKIPDYLYPFLKTRETGKPFQYLRLSSLGALGALVKNDDPIVPHAVHYFLETELLPLCLQCIEIGENLSKTVAAFIVSKILMQDEGLAYCCYPIARFYSMMGVFGSTIEKMGDTPSPRLLKNILQCYLRMSEVPRASDALRNCLPPQLRSTKFIHNLREDPVCIQKLQQLFYNVTWGHWKNAGVEDVSGRVPKFR